MYILKLYLLVKKKV
jgi:hypothetical protein